ncbi:hypothetical protein V490_00163 [Pseudogymnoascus sp. VKM F-3557]|nr:hypothetical protein V490_00163 [Pseudogymnoascus sp. VKM F-3557]
MAPDTLSLQGKVAIVTGSGRENGIGAGIARALARNGASVTINYVSDSVTPRAKKLVEELKALGGNAIAVQADVSHPDSCKKIVDETLQAFNTKSIDILINNANGKTDFMPLQATEEQLQAAFSVNVFGTIFMMQAVIDYMPRGGRIINTSSVAVKLGLEFFPLYVASKAASDALAFSLASELGKNRGITINIIAPGPVTTDMFPKIPQIEPLRSHLVGLTRAESREGTPDDIADAVLLLCSEKSRWITGQFISVSGGITGN